MANDNFIMRAEDSIKCSQENYDMLVEALKDYSQLEVCYDNGDLYIYSESECTFEFFDNQADWDEVMGGIGNIIKEAGMKYLTFYYASYCDKPRPASCGGGEFRIMPDGRAVFPKMEWPND